MFDAAAANVFSLTNTQSRCQAKRLNYGTNQMMTSHDAEVQLLLPAKKNVLVQPLFVNRHLKGMFYTLFDDHFRSNDTFS